MNELSKRQVDENFGKYGFFEGTGKELLISKVEYLTGISPFDSRLGGQPFNRKTQAIYFEKRPKGFEIKLGIGFDHHRVCFNFSQINYFVIEAQQHIYELKSKSIVGRAVLGGLILGPVGAIVGGMTGFGDKKIQKDDMPDNILTISVSEDEQEKLILFAVQNKNLKDVETYIKLYFPQLFRPVQKIVEQDTKVVSIADEISKLKSLFDEGVLTKEEFETQKSKLLSK